GGLAARKFRGQAARCGLTGADARAGAAPLGERHRRAHHHAVAAALGRGRLLEARLQQRRADEPGRAGAAPRRIRQAEGKRARQSRPLRLPPGGAWGARPVEGGKNLGCRRGLAAPSAGYRLAVRGADAIRGERREGEDMRRTPLSREWAERGLAPGWQAINGNKRSLTLDLSKPEAIAIAKQLAAQADVVMENFRPGVMDKLGIGYAELSQVNPRLIYC